MLCVTDENCNDLVYIGNILVLHNGCNWGYNCGYVTAVWGADSTLKIVSTEHDRVGQQFEVPISAVHVSHFRCTSDEIYN